MPIVPSRFSGTSALGSRVWLWLIVGACCGWSWGVVAAAEPSQDLAKSLTFYASFDQSTDADLARGDRQLYHSPDLSRQQRLPGLPAQAGISLATTGKFGGSLQFTRRAEQVIYYLGADNIAYRPQDFGGTVSLWMKLNPDQDLEPGYVDPLQITDKDWNNSSLFVDFTKDDNPRHFRLGVFSDLTFWNPQNRDWDTIPEAERPMVVSRKPPFSREQWTQVAFTWEGFQAAPAAGSAKTTPTKSAVHFYLNGESIGTLEQPQQFTWDPQKVVMMLGIYYTGGMDELAIFDRPLSAIEIQQLQQASESLAKQVSR